MMNKPKLFKTQLGGESFLEMDLYTVAGVSALVTSLSTPLTQLNGSVGIWLLRMAIANFAALSLVAIVFLALRRVTKAKHFGGSIGNWDVVCFGAILGLIKGAATGTFLWILGAEQSLIHALMARIFQSTFLGIVTVISISMLSVARAKLENDRRLVIAELVSADIGTRGLHVDQAASRLKEFTDVARKKLSEASIFPENLEIQVSAKEAFTKVIDDILIKDLRPLSQKLWEIESNKIPGLSVLELLRISISKRRLRLVPVLVAFFPVEWFTLIAKYGIWVALLLASIHACALGLVLYSVNAVGVKTTMQGALRVLLVPLACVLLSLLASNRWSGELTPIALILYSFGEYIWICQIILVSGFIFAVISAKSRIDQELNKLLGGIGPTYPLAQARSLFLNREMANYLHGAVQNKLIAASLRIQNLEGQEDRQRIIEELDSLLASSAENFLNREASDIQMEIADIAYRWKAIVDIGFNVNTNLGSNYQFDIEVMSQLINEGITNAVRHGIASEIEILVETSSYGCKLTILDNGIGPRKSRPGLGSHLFTSVAGSRWSLQQRPEGGSILEVEVRV